MSQTKTRVMIYSSNVSDKNKGYGMLFECMTQKKRVMVCSLNVSDKNNGFDIFLECLTKTRVMV
jgi:hypothetical protein